MWLYSSNNFLVPTVYLIVSVFIVDSSIEIFLLILPLFLDDI